MQVSISTPAQPLVDPAAAPVVTPEATVTTEVTGERPAGLPEKFKTVDELVKAYGELETKQSTTTETPKVESPKIVSQPKNPIETAGIDVAALNAEMADKGELSAETVKTLGTKGITPEILKVYFEGQKAIQIQMVTAIQGEVGGADNFAAMLAWAGANLNEAEAAAYNKAIDSGDTETAKLLIRGVNAKFAEATGSDPKLITGDTSQPTGVKGFTTPAQMTDAINDPRYRTDADYRKSVEQKIFASDFVS